jgi:hypothetical protein
VLSAGGTPAEGTGTKIAKAELWFLQPEECLVPKFGFIYLHALKFDKVWGHATKKPKYHRSNGCGYWSENARKVAQRVAVATFVDNDGETSETGTKSCTRAAKQAVVKSLISKLDQATNDLEATKAPAQDTYVVHRLRKPESALCIAKVLSNKLGWEKVFDDVLLLSDLRATLPCVMYGA